MTFRTTSRRFLVLQYVVFKNVPVNLAVRVTAFAQEKSASERACFSDASAADVMASSVEPPIKTISSAAAVNDTTPVEEVVKEKRLVRSFFDEYMN